MNKMKKYLLTLAAFAAATTFFTACSSEDDLSSAEQDGHGVVKTDFTISFPKQMSATTRQSVAIVQGQTPPVFRGINNIELRPLSLTKEAIIASSDLSSITAPTPITLTALHRSRLFSTTKLSP